MDSGASHDVAPGQQTRDVYAPQVRALLDECSVDTANATVTVTDGVRVRLGHWDAIIDGTVMDGCDSNLASIGQRVCHAGFTHIWVRGLFPCFISPDAKTIIIFDISGVVPIYSPSMEDYEHTLLGSFSLKSNEFREI